MARSAATGDPARPPGGARVSRLKVARQRSEPRFSRAAQEARKGLRQDLTQLRQDIAKIRDRKMKQPLDWLGLITAYGQACVISLGVLLHTITISLGMYIAVATPIIVALLGHQEAAAITAAVEGAVHALSWWFPTQRAG